MRVVILNSADEVSRFAADRVCEIMLNSGTGNRHAKVLGLATGGTPLGLYRELIERHRAGMVSFANVTSFNLDEYVGIAHADPRSYHSYMNDHLFRHVDIAPERTHVPDTESPDLVASSLRYENMISAAGGIDLQILGIGSDGHIGFNEIGSSLGSRTRVKTLTHKTRSDNARYFDGLDSVPKMAVTMGIGTIMDARSVLLLATGSGKATAVRNSIEGPITAAVPASVLQWHPDATFVIDDAAAAELLNREYYIESERNHAEMRQRLNSQKQNTNHSSPIGFR